MVWDDSSAGKLATIPPVAPRVSPPWMDGGPDPTGIGELCSAHASSKNKNAIESEIPVVFISTLRVYESTIPQLESSTWHNLTQHPRAQPFQAILVPRPSAARS
jgi:hypothetical protein